MSKARISIAVPTEILAQARRAVRAKRATSVSAYFAESAAEHARRDELKTLLSELDREHGRPSREAQAWARRVLGS